jgi:hypothetical protein
MGAARPNQQRGKESAAKNQGTTSQDTKKIDVDVLEQFDTGDEDDPNQQYYQPDAQQNQNNMIGGGVMQPHPLLQGSESGDLLKKLISNIQNNHSLRNQEIRA